MLLVVECLELLRVDLCWLCTWQDLSSMAFRFKDKERPATYVCRCASSLHVRCFKTPASSQLTRLPFLLCSYSGFDWVPVNRILERDPFIIVITGFGFNAPMDHVKLHSHGNGCQYKQTYRCLKGLHTCKIHANVTTVIQKIIFCHHLRFSLPIFCVMPIFCAVIFVVIISNFCGFTSETSETRMDDGFTRQPKLVSVS